jgi:hypothetical protein
VTLLGAQLQYAPGPAAAEEDPSAQSPAIPAALMRRLRRAAQYHQVTDFKVALREIEEQVPDSLGFSRRLRRCLHTYDMAAILRALDAEPAPTAVGGDS